MKKYSKSINSQDLIFYCHMILALALMNMLPARISTAMGQGSINQTSTSNTTRLKIAIPVRGFGDFVKVTHDNITGEHKIGGFAVEVFKAVVAALPKPFLYDLIPFDNPDGTPKGTFDDMLKAVFSKEYDGAVGDISLVYDRTEWVDFTLPYMDTGISMLVPFQQQQSKKITKISLSRVTKGFVAATLAFSFIVALVFWVIEHRNDKCISQPRLANFDPPAAQYHHDEWRREILRSMIQTRLVTVLFFMVLLVFTACYAASQTSSLSETGRRVPVKNLNQLIRTEAYVGYQQGSFIYNLLLDKGFLESKLIAFNTSTEMYDLLSQGRVAAVIGLTPHLLLRQNGHCDSLAFVPTFNIQAAGFGFAFRIDYSQLVRDMSNGILQLISNGKMRRIQERTIGSLETCQDEQNDGNSSDLIDTDTLWILVAGAIGAVFLMIIVMMVQCGITCATTRKKKKALAYPCYVLPCC